MYLHGSLKENCDDLNLRTRINSSIHRLHVHRCLLNRNVQRLCSHRDGMAGLFTEGSGRPTLFLFKYAHWDTRISSSTMLHVYLRRRNCISEPTNILYRGFSNTERVGVRPTQHVSEPDPSNQPMNRRPHSLSLAHGELQRAAQPIFSFRHRWSVLPLIIASSSFHHSTTTTTTTAPGLHQGMMSDFSLSGQLEHTRKTLKHPNSRSTSVERGEARYSPSRDYPTSAINQPPRLYSEFSRSDHSGFDHAMETQASYLQREDFYQDRKRYKVDNQLIAASTRHPNVTANRQSVSDNVVGQCDWDEESQTSYTQNEGYYQDRRRYEVVDDRFIAARTRQPNTTIHDMNMGPCVSNNAMARKPRSSEQSSAPINGNNPPLLPWRLCDEQRFSNHYGFGPGTNVEAPYPGKCNRDATRYDVGDVWKPTMACQASSSFQPNSRNYSLQRELSTYRSKPTPHLLWGPEDKQHLTELHCFVRKYCIYIFSATHQDIESKLNGQYMFDSAF